MSRTDTAALAEGQRPPLPAAAASSRPHWQGLDGLRAIAVIAVVVFHFGVDLPGGFLGVDVFFGISGYLITRLLVREFLADGRVDLLRFYRRRARRLLPALAAVLAVVSLAALVWRDQLATVRGMVISTGLFSSNWWLAFDHQSYFVATGRPSMLRHLWSLGVEEQFYLLWPLVLGTTLALARRRARRRGTPTSTRLVRPLCAVAAALALASTALTWWLADRSNVPYGSDGSFLYYGTDTHCMGLLLGAALGAWAAEREGQPIDAAADGRPTRTAAAWRVAVTALGIAGLGVLFACFGQMADYTTWLYRGGFLLVAVAICAVIAAATRPGHWLGRALDTPVLRWIGLRSYSIYLWHWPVVVVTRPGLDLSIPTLLVQLLRGAVILALSELTYRYVEVPARRAGLRAAAAAVGRRIGSLARGPSVVAVGATAVAGIVVAAAAVIAIGPAAPLSGAALTAVRGGTHLSLKALHRHPVPVPAGRARPRPQQHPTGHETHRATSNHRAAHRATARPAASRHRLPRLSAFGDSVLLGARSELARRFHGGTIDAVEGRQPGPILDDVRRRARAGRLAPVVVLHLGDNGLIDPEQLTRTMQDLSSTPLVLVLTDHIDSYDGSWQGPNNAVIRRVVPRFRNARIINWDHIAGEHHGWLYPDDTHLQPAGRVGYARMIAAAVRTAQREDGIDLTASAHPSPKAKVSAQRGGDGL